MAERTWLLFDVYGTLGDPGSLADALRPYHHDAEGLAGKWRLHQLEISWLLTLMDRYEDFEAVTRYALETTLGEVGLELSDAEKRALLAGVGRLELYEDVRSALDRLTGAGLGLGILSNWSPRMLEALLGSAGIRDRFEPVISVDEVRAFKPSPVVYRHAAQRVGRTPDQVWLVSGNPFDAAGAKAAGMRVAKVERERSLRYPFAETPDLVVSSLVELADESGRLQAGHR